MRKIEGFETYYTSEVAIKPSIPKLMVQDLAGKNLPRGPWNCGDFASVLSHIPKQHGYLVIKLQILKFYFNYSFFLHLANCCVIVYVLVCVRIVKNNPNRAMKPIDLERKCLKLNNIQINSV